MKPGVLILGASGRFGAAAKDSFVKQGWRVIAQSRSAPGQEDGVQWISAAANEREAIARAAQGVQVVVHGWNPDYTRWHEDLLPMAEQAMQIAEKLNATLLLPGNVYNFGSSMPAVLTEDTPQHADTRKGMLRVQLEHLMARRCEQGRLRAVVLRAGDFYGAGSGNWFDMAIAKDLRRGKLVYPGALNQSHAWAYLPDLTETAALLMQGAINQAQRFKPFEVFHFSGYTLTGQHLYESIASLRLHPQKQALKLASLPWGLMRIGSPFVPIWRELVEMRYLWDVPHRLDDSKLKALVGDIPKTDIAQALRLSIK